MNSEEMKNRLKHFAINVAKLTQQLPDTLLNRFIKAKSSSQAVLRLQTIVHHKEQNQDLILSTKEKLLKKNWTKHCFFWKCLKNSISNFLKS